MLVKFFSFHPTNFTCVTLPKSEQKKPKTTTNNVSQVVSSHPVSESTFFFFSFAVNSCHNQLLCVVLEQDMVLTLSSKLAFLNDKLKGETDLTMISNICKTINEVCEALSNYSKVKHLL